MTEISMTTLNFKNIERPFVEEREAPPKLNGSAHPDYDGSGPDDARAELISAARRLVYFEDFNKVVELDWLIKGVLAKGHNTNTFGPPGSGKSGLLGSAAVHIGAGSPEWHGFKIPKKCGSVYFAFERAPLVEKRIWAEAQRDGLGEVPVTVCPGIINLLDPKCVREIVGTILAAEDKFGLEVGLAIFDTVNKGIADGGGDENQAKDQNRAWGNLRRVHELMERYHPLHVAGIGHTGKDESRGSRGSNAGQGDNDVEFQISKDGDIKAVAINKANELPEGPLMRFRMEPFDTGLKDQDGDAIEVWIPGAQTVAAPTAGKAGPKLTKNQQTMYSILHDAGSGGLTAEQWNEKLRDVGIGTKRKADIYDNRASLLGKHLVREFNGIWRVSI
jgi:AAA domain